MVLFLGVDKAEAGVIFYNTGTDVVEVADIKEEFREEYEAKYEPGVKVGLVYERFGLFWLDIWRWDAHWAIVSEDGAAVLPKEELENIADGSLSKPITMTLPPGLIVLLLGGIGFGIFAFVTRNDEDDENIYEDGIAQEQGAHPGQDPGQDPQQYAQQPGQQYQPPQAQHPGQAPQYQPPQAQQPGQAPQQYQPPQQPGQAPQQYQHPGQAQPQQPGQAPQHAQYPPQPGQPGYDPNNQG